MAGPYDSPYGGFKKNGPGCCDCGPPPVPGIPSDCWDDVGPDSPNKPIDVVWPQKMPPGGGFGYDAEVVTVSTSPTYIFVGGVPVFTWSSAWTPVPYTDAEFANIYGGYSSEPTWPRYFRVVTRCGGNCPDVQTGHSADDSGPKCNYVRSGTFNVPIDSGMPAEWLCFYIAIHCDGGMPDPFTDPGAASIYFVIRTLTGGP